MQTHKRTHPSREQRDQFKLVFVHLFASLYMARPASRMYSLHVPHRMAAAPIVSISHCLQSHVRTYLYQWQWKCYKCSHKRCTNCTARDAEERSGVRSMQRFFLQWNVWSLKVTSISYPYSSYAYTTHTHRRIHVQILSLFSWIRIVS